MSVKLKKILSFLLFLLIVLLIVFYVKDNLSEFRNIKVASWWSLVGLVIFTGLTFLIQGWFLKVAVLPYKVNLSFNEWFGLVAVTMLGNYIFPFSGWGVRAIYLKNKHSLSYSQFIATTVANWITNFLVFTLGGLLGVGVIYYLFHKFETKLFIFLFLVLAFSCVAFIPIKQLKHRNKFIKKILNLFKIWQEYITHKQILQQLIVITFWQFLATVLSFYYAYRFFGFGVSVWESFLPATFSIYALFIRLVPANLGLYELAVIYPSRIFGLNIADGLLVSAITRLAVIFWTFVLGLIFSYILIKPFSKTKGAK
ncbi:MAG: lysylphosphatidylglycerol synthase transmembrane domain-containing protein [Patescibacteria group bacterium]